MTRRAAATTRRGPRSVACVGLALGMFLSSAGLSAASTKPVDGKVRGRVIDAKTGAGVAEATVFIRDWRAVCDAEGRFFIVVPAGRWTLEGAAHGFRVASTTVDVCSGCEPEVELALLPVRLVEETVEVTASVSGVGDLVATTPVRPMEVLNMAGGFENVFRVLQTLPGVSGTDEWSSRLSVRGGGPDQNMTLMDGVEIHNPYRLFGLVSAFNPETVANFELSTGAFSARYGDRLSSILTVENRPGKTSTLATGSVGLGLTDGNAIFEGRLPGQIGSWLVTGRRTWYDLVGKAVSDDEDTLPGFGDVQARVAFDLGGSRSLTFSGLRSRERSDVEFDEDFDSGLFDSRTHNDLVSATLFLPLGARATWRTTAAIYENTDRFNLNGRFRDELRRSNSPDDDGFSFDDVVGTLLRRVRDRSLRHETTIVLPARHMLSAGFELHDLATREALDIQVRNRPQEGLWPTEVSHDVEPRHRRYGAWLIDQAQLVSWLDAEVGLRFDRSRINGRSELMPRVSLTARTSPTTRLRAAFGMHTQSPGYEKLFQADYALDLTRDGRVDLRNEKAQHVVVGFERDLPAGFSLRVEGFHKRFRDLIVPRLETPAEAAARVARYDFPAALAASVPRQRLLTSLPSNEGRGRAVGVDLLLARRATSSSSRLTGWLAYTYTSANRRAYDRTYPFTYEQPHALSMVASLRVSPRFELSATARLASGFPRTAPLGLRVTGTEDARDADRDGNTTEVIPERDAAGRLVYAVDYGSVDNLNGSRLPWYSRLDVRTTFIPRWGKGRWRLYLDFINALARNNGPVLEELAYDPTSDRPRVTTKRENGLPFLPSFGIHVRF